MTIKTCASTKTATAAEEGGVVDLWGSCIFSIWGENLELTYTCSRLICWLKYSRPFIKNVVTFSLTIAVDQSISTKTTVTAIGPTLGVDLLTGDQSPHFSQILALTTFIENGFHNNMKTKEVFLDLTAAYEIAWNISLLIKISRVLL